MSSLCGSRGEKENFNVMELTINAMVVLCNVFAAGTYYASTTYRDNSHPNLIFYWVSALTFVATWIIFVVFSVCSFVQKYRKKND